MQRAERSKFASQLISLIMLMASNKTVGSHCDEQLVAVRCMPQAWIEVLYGKLASLPASVIGNIGARKETGQDS